MIGYYVLFLVIGFVAGYFVGHIYGGMAKRALEREIAEKKAQVEELKARVETFMKPPVV